MTPIDQSPVVARRVLLSACLGVAFGIAYLAALSFGHRMVGDALSFVGVYGFLVIAFAAPIVGVFYVSAWLATEHILRHPLTFSGLALAITVAFSMLVLRAVGMEDPPHLLSVVPGLISCSVFATWMKVRPVHFDAARK